MIEDRIVLAFKRIDALRVDEPLLDVLYLRLIAELFGDGDSVATTLEPDFELVVHSGIANTTVPANMVIAGVRAQRSTGVLLWTDFDELIVEGEVVAGHGMLCSLRIARRALTTTPIAVFLRFTTGRMASEVVYVGCNSATATITSDEMPSIERLHARLAPERDV